MPKILLTVAVTVFLVLFGMQNSDHVPVSLIVGSPRQVRLVFLLALATAFGFLFSYISRLSREATLKREVVRLTRLCKSALSELPNTGDEEGIDD